MTAPPTTALPGAPPPSLEVLRHAPVDPHALASHRFAYRRDDDGVTMSCDACELAVTLPHDHAHGDALERFIDQHDGR